MSFGLKVGVEPRRAGNEAARLGTAEILAGAVEIGDLPALVGWRLVDNGGRDEVCPAVLPGPRRPRWRHRGGRLPGLGRLHPPFKDSGALVGGEHLHETETATSVRVRGDRLLTDGPFAETKEHLLGFFLIEVPDLDAALDWAAKAPLIGFGTVEVRGAHTGAAWQAVLNE